MTTTLQDVIDAVSHDELLRGAMLTNVERMIGRHGPPWPQTINFARYEPIRVGGPVLETITETVTTIRIPDPPPGPPPSPAEIQALARKLSDAEQRILEDLLMVGNEPDAHTIPAVCRHLHPCDCRVIPPPMWTPWPPLEDMVRAHEALMMSPVAGHPPVGLGPPSSGFGSGIPPWGKASVVYNPPPIPWPGTCPLCGQVPDPDVEPVELELPSTRYHTARTVEACSRECATAYAMSLDLRKPPPPDDDRRRPDLRAHVEDLDRKTEALLREHGLDITDSLPSAEPDAWQFSETDRPPVDLMALRVARHNPWQP